MESGSGHGITQPGGGAAKKAFRKRPRLSDSGNEDTTTAAGADEINTEALRDLQEERRRRIRSGLDAAVLISGPRSHISKHEGASAVTTAEAPVGLQPGAKSATILGGGFRASAGADPDAVDPLMRAYIDRRMAELGVGAPRDVVVASDQPSQAAAAATADASLYALPEEMRVIAPRARSDADVGEGGMMLAGTGIAEVALPVAFKLANIEATEAAKQAWLARRAGGDIGALEGIGATAGGDAALADDDVAAGLGAARVMAGSLTANYNLHRREYAERATGRTHVPGGAAGLDSAQRSAAAPIDVGVSGATSRGTVPQSNAAAAAAGAGISGASVRPERKMLSRDDQVASSFRRREIARR